MINHVYFPAFVILNPIIILWQKEKGLPAVLSSSKSTPAPILSKSDGMPAPPIILDIPEEVMEEEEEDIIVEEDEKDLEELELIMLDPEDIKEPRSPPKDIICPPPPPMLMPSIIFFIISSISKDMPPGPPLEDVVVEDEDMLEEEKVLELEKEPSSLLVEVAIICEADEESCLTEVLPSSVV